MSLLWAAASSLLLAACGPPPARDAKDSRTLEQKMVDLVNLEREARGIDRLQHSPALAAVAREHSRKMALTRDVSHEAEGTRMEERIRSVVPDACGFAENISRHFTIDYAIGDLLGSPGHRANLLNPEATLVGIGIVLGEDDFLYITQNFARRCRQDPAGRP